MNRKEPGAFNLRMSVYLQDENVIQWKAGTANARVQGNLPALCIQHYVNFQDWKMKYLAASKASISAVIV